MDAIQERFAFAREHEHELNQRQRQVLDLIERGRTNQEIADHLGVTLAGAKWHVSEILSKLGFASREEAAEYWHARRTSFGRRLAAPFRAIAGAIPFKWAAGGAGALCVTVAVVAILSTTRDDGDFKGAYFEIRVTFESPIPDPYGRPGVGGGMYRAWYGPEYFGSLETTMGIGTVEEQTLVTGRQGDRYWAYNPVSGSHQFYDQEIEPASYRLPVMSAFPGPVDADTLDDYVGRVRSSDPHMLVEVKSQRKILGRQTIAVRYGPVSRNATAADPAPGDLQPRGFITTWLDTERMVVMRMEFEFPDLVAVHEVTDFQWDRRQPSARLESLPPPDSTEGPFLLFALPRQTSPVSAVNGMPPRPFMEVEEVGPWEAVAHFRTDFADESTGSDSVYRRPSATNRLIIQQLKRPSLPESVTTGSPQQVGPYEVWLHQRGDGPFAALYHNGLAVSVQGTGGTTEEEVLAAVASLRIVP